MLVAGTVRGQAVLGGLGAESPGVCAAGGLAELWPAHTTAVSLHCAAEKPRPQDGSYSEASQNITAKAMDFPVLGKSSVAFLSQRL